LTRSHHPTFLSPALNTSSSTASVCCFLSLRTVDSSPVYQQPDLRLVDPTFQIYNQHQSICSPPKSHALQSPSFPSASPLRQSRQSLTMLPSRPSAPLPPRSRHCLPPHATPVPTSEGSRHTSRLHMPTHRTPTRRASSAGRAHRPAAAQACRAQPHGKSDSARSPWCTASHQSHMMRAIDTSESPRRHGGVVMNERTTPTRIQVKHPIAVLPPTTVLDHSS